MSSAAKPPKNAVTYDDLKRHQEMIANRVKKNYKKLAKGFEKANIGAYRLFDRDIPEIRAAIDWYEGHLVVAEYERSQTGHLPQWLPSIARAAAEALDVPAKQVHLKRRRTKTPGEDRYQKQTKSCELVVREGSLKFLVDLEKYIDTGLFSDHRLTRKRVAEEAEGKRVLNLFAYTGAFSCAVAQGGALASTTVDLSKTYSKWCERNFELNQINSSKHEILTQECFDFLEEAKKQRRKFQLCIVDPPSYSTKGHTNEGWDVRYHHQELLKRVLQVTSSGGVIYFSTNHQAFMPKFEGLNLSEEKEITESTVPPDYRNRTIHRCFRLVKA